MVKKTTVFEHVTFVCSVLNILYYVIIVFFCKHNDMLISERETGILPVIICSTLLIAKTFVLFFVKKRIGVVVGLSIIVSAFYNCCTIKAVGFVSLGVAFVVALILVGVKRIGKNAAINIILPFMVVLLLWGGYSVLETAPVTHITTDTYSNTSGTYIILKDTTWHFNTPIETEVRVVESDAIERVGHLMVIPGEGRRGWTVFFTEYYGRNENERIYWIDNMTFSINGKEGTVK